MAESGPNFDGDDIDSMLDSANEQAGVTEAQTADLETRKPGQAEELIDQAEADLERALDESLDGAEKKASAEKSKFEFEEFASSAGAGSVLPIESLQDVELKLRIELGRTELLIDDVMKLSEGSVVQLDKLAGDPVDILVNGRPIARGEILVLNDNFCVRVVEILTPDI